MTASAVHISTVGGVIREMRGETAILQLIKLIGMLTIVKQCHSLARPPPKTTSASATSVFSTVFSNKPEWVDTQGTSYTQPEVSKGDIKIVSWNVLGKHFNAYILVGIGIDTGLQSEGRCRDESDRVTAWEKG